VPPAVNVLGTLIFVTAFGFIALQMVVQRRRSGAEARAQATP